MCPTESCHAGLLKEFSPLATLLSAVPVILATRHCRHQHMKPLLVLAWNTIKSAGIARRTRSRRGGTAITKIHRIKPITPALRDSESFTNAAGMIGEPNRAYMQINSSGHNNIIIAREPMNPTLPTSKSMRFSLLNLRSVRNKTPSLKDLTVDRNIDVFAATETRLAKETDELIIRDLCPTDYEFYNVPRVSDVGGGIGVMHKTVVRLEKHGIVTNFKSFEFTNVLLKHSSLCLRLIIVYRSQTMAEGTSSAAKFFEELPTFLESLAIVPSFLLIVSDFNLHVNDASDRCAQRFLRLLEAFNLKQHVWVPTHRSGNTLDLVITRNDESTARDFDVFDPVISNHYVVSCSLALPKEAFERKEVNYRKLKSIDLQELRDDISDSPLISTVDKAGHDLEYLITLYNTTLIGLLDKHAPLKTRTITIRPSAPWYTEDIR